MTVPSCHTHATKASGLVSLLALFSVTPGVAAPRAVEQLRAVWSGLPRPQVARHQQALLTA